MKALVLSGGNVKGAFQAGAIRCLYSRGWEPDIVAGISIGAINGAVVATGHAEALEDLWLQVDERDVIRRRSLSRLAWEVAKSYLPFFEEPLGLHSMEPLHQLVRRTLLAQQFILPFYAGRVDLTTGKYHSDIPAGVIDDRTVNYILASAMVPVVMEPIRIGGSILVDGGVYNVTPIADVISRHKDEITEIVIITTQPITKSAPAIDRELRAPGILRVLKAVIDQLLDAQFERDLRHYLDRNAYAEMLGPHITEKSIRYFPTSLIAPESALGPGDDYSSANIRRLYKLGKEAAQMIAPPSVAK